MFLSGPIKSKYCYGYGLFILKFAFSIFFAPFSQKEKRWQPLIVNRLKRIVAAGPFPFHMSLRKANRAATFCGSESSGSLEVFKFDPGNQFEYSVFWFHFINKKLDKLLTTHIREAFFYDIIVSYLIEPFSPGTHYAD